MFMFFFLSKLDLVFWPGSEKLYFKIYEKIILILNYVFSFVHIPFILMITILSFAQFPEDQLLRQLVSSLKYFLCRVAAATYYVIYSFISF